ncbi:MAG: chromosome segregation protein SMC [Planctomycetota bacterium]
MYLKKLCLSGFKSFADSTEFLFHRGTTAVVGPNGCGKSNVVDAFRWVLGERSAKELRGSEMLDVIFKGAGSRDPLSRAEVSLVFDNEDQALAVDHSEVEVTRRLYRSGESEYLINGQGCRLKDLLALFADTGVGSHGYSVLEQGNVDGFLHANPAERRVIFEEAAGISRYKKQKVQSVRQLERTDANLLRLRDIHGEVERRIRSVKLQAARARRYIEDRDLVEKLRAVIAVRDIDQFQGDRAEFCFDLALADARRTMIGGLGRQLEANTEHARSSAAAARERLTELRQAEMELRLGIERAQQRLAHLAERRHAIDEGFARRAEQRTELSVAAAEYEQRRQQTRQALRGEITQLRDLRRDLAAAELERARLTRERDALESRLHECKQQALTCLYDETKANNELSGLESEGRGVVALLDRRAAELEEFRAEFAEHEAHWKAFHEELALVSAQRVELQAESERLRAEVAERTELLTGAQRELSTRRERFARDEARLRFLEGLEESREGIGRGVQRLLDTDIALSGDVVGLLADVIEADATTAPMVDAVLGSLAETVVFLGGTSAAARARALRGFLGVDGLRFCSMESVLHQRAVSHERKAAGAESSIATDTERPRLLSRIQFDPAYANLLERTFGDVLLAQDLDDAVERAERSHSAHRYVTPDGCLVEPWGTITLPSRGDHQLVSRRSEIHSLRVDLRRQETALQEAAEHGARLERAIESRREEASQKEEEGRRRQLEQESLQRKLVELDRSMARLRERQQTVEREIAELERSRVEIERLRGGVVQRIADLQERRSALEAQSAGGDEERDRLTSEVDVHESAVSRLHLSSTQREERMLSLRREEVRLRGEMQERESRCLRLEREDEDDQSRIGAMEAEAAACEVRRVECEGRLAELETRVEAEQLQVQRLEEELREAARLTRSVHEEDDALRSEREGLMVRENELGVRIRALREKLHVEFQIDLAQAPLDQWLRELRQEDEEDEALYDRLRPELEQAVDRLRKNSNVNLEAVEELTELEARFEFLGTQIADLESAKTSLLATIESLNERCREMFLTCFAEVRGHFQELFQTMFEGGTSDLRLEEGVDPLEAGIEVVARPPGKRISSLKLLSGGEKALTAISVLFALFRTKPSPFCILDEVDAPLDEANVRRFVRALKEFTGDTQFLIVTHNKVTMSKAERLYGITMQERGVSQRISVQIEQVEQLGLIEPGMKRSSKAAAVATVDSGPEGAEEPDAVEAGV